MTTINIDDARTEAESALQIEFDKQEFTSTATCVQIVLDAALPHLTPRTITTLDELANLPGQTVIRDAGGRVYENARPAQPYNWTRRGGYIHRKDIDLPALVLFHPTDTPGEV